MGDIPSVDEEMIDQQRHADEYDRADDDRVEVSVEQAKSRVQAQPKAQFPREEEGALHRATLAVLREFDEEEQKAAAQQSEGESRHHGHIGRDPVEVARQQHQEAHEEDDQSRDGLALQFSIGENVFLRQQGQQKSRQHQRVEGEAQGQGEEQSEGGRDQDGVDDERRALWQKEAVEAPGPHHLVRRAEGEGNHVHQDDREQGAACGGQRQDGNPEDLADDHRRERTQGQRAAARPGEHMARLRAVERLAGVEHERAIDHHFGQSVAEALEDAYGQRAGESDVEDLLYVRLVENGREDHQEEDGEQTDLVAAKALDEVGDVGAGDHDAQSKGQHDQSHVPQRVAVSLHLRGDIGQKHEDGDAQQQVGENQHPEVAAPDAYVYRCVLCVHNGISIAFTFVGKLVALDGLAVGPYAAAQFLAHGGKLAEKLRFETLCQAHGVGIDQYLAVAVAASANTDGRHAEQIRHLLGHRGRYLLQHHGEAARLLQRLGVGDELRGLHLAACAHTVASQFVDALRGEPEVAHDGDSRVDDTLDGGRDFLAAFEFHGIDARLTDQPDGVAHAFLRRDLITAKRHVADHQRPLATSCHAARIDDHLVQGDGEGGVVALHHVGGRVADQNAVNARLVYQSCRRIVVGREHGYLVAVALHLYECLDGNFFLFCCEISHFY